jgi:capsular exopolysaccharide synthesis family protein
MNSISFPPRSSTAAAPTDPSLRVGAPTDQVPLVRQYLRIALRWRFVILTAVVVCIMLSLVVTLLMTPKYTSTSTIEISREASKVTDFQGVEREASVADQEFYQTQYGLLRSRSLAERVALQLRLVDDPNFFQRFGVPSDDAEFSLVNGRYPASGRAARQRAAGEILLRNVSVAPTRMSRLVDISFTSPDAAFSTRVANAWAENFIQTNLERKMQATYYGRNLLERQLGQTKERLDQSLRQLVNYASEQRIINLPAQGDGDQKATSERSVVADELAALNVSLAQATADRIQSQARYNQAGRPGSSDTALRNQAINMLRQRRAESAAEYERLMTQFAPEYPPARALQAQIRQLDRSITGEEGRVSASVLAEYRQAQERERTLQARVEQLKSSYLDLRRRSIQYNIYQQEVDTNRSLYDGLLQRYKEIGVAGGVGINNVSVVDVAQVPERPSSPRMLINLLIALLAGLVIGAGAALVLEQIDEAIGDPAEIEKSFGLPLLGTVPKVDSKTPKDALLDRKSDLVDAYIAIQTNLGLTTEHGIPRSFAVTSTRPAEGKSTTALALAMTLARSKRSVILIDGDMRSPSVHHLAEIPNKQGLSNFLAGHDDEASLIFDSAELGIAVMPAGPVPPNAAELLTGGRLLLLMEKLLPIYEHVVIDSPPMMGLADAPLIASRVEGVIYAIESHGIRSGLVKTAIDRLRNANTPIIGGILTKFVARKSHYGYTYGYEYGYGYGRGGADDKSTTA